jgi:hypothetical protein
VGYTILALGALTFMGVFHAVREANRRNFEDAYYSMTAAVFFAVAEIAIISWVI